MTKKSRKVETEQLVAEIVNGLQEKKGKDIVSLDLRKIDTAVTDFFCALYWRFQYACKRTCR